jgi:hypothetical protein
MEVLIVWRRSTLRRMAGFGEANLGGHRALFVDNTFIEMFDLIQFDKPDPVGHQKMNVRLRSERFRRKQTRRAGERHTQLFIQRE